MRQSHQKVDIVTVNWNAGGQLEECVRSVREQEPDVVGSFTIVDNGSTDGSADFLSGWDKVRIDKTGKNLGFGRGCNRGAKQSASPYILFLNPDTRLTEPAIAKAIAFLESPAGRSYGICGIKLLDETGRVTRHCARFPTVTTFASIVIGIDRLFPGKAPSLLMADFDHLSSRPVDHVQGAFYLIRRRLFEEIGGFDEDYFVYFEDLDLSLRASRRGQGSYYLADAQAFHRGGGTSSQVKGKTRYYGIDARILYGQKHFSRAGNMAHIAMSFLIEPPATFAWHLMKYRGAGLGNLVQAFKLLFGDMGRIVSRRPYPSGSGGLSRQRLPNG